MGIIYAYTLTDTWKPQQPHISRYTSPPQFSTLLVLAYDLDIFAPESRFQEAAFLMRGPVVASNFKDCFVATTGATFKEISRGVFKPIEFLHQPAKLVRRFEDAAAPMAQQASTLQRQIQNLRRTRDLLVERLLSGQVDLKREAA